MLSVLHVSLASLFFALSLAGPALSAPEGFPSSGNGLWYTTPGTIWSRHNLPVGNGFLAATTPGGVGFEATQLNIESLWSGGPFSDAVRRMIHHFLNCFYRSCIIIRVTMAETSNPVKRTS